MNQEFLEQLERWHQDDQYRQIIDAIEALPPQERTAELVSQQARAYNNLAQAGDRALFQRAVALLRSVEGELEHDHNWNYRLAYAYYYLDQEGPALRHFRRALDARPGDGDTLEMIADCEERLSLPLGLKPFRVRVEEGWASFQAGEGELRALMDRKDRQAVGEQLLSTCSALLAPALEEVNFELGYNGEKYELILTPEGDRARLFKLVYFQRRAPAQLLQRWNILVGRVRSGGLGLRMYGQDISAADARVWLEELEGERLGLSVYCEKLLPLLREDEDRAYALMAILLDQAIGELAAMRFVGSLDLLEQPRKGQGVGLEQLAETIAQKVGPQRWQLCTPAALCQQYTGYRMQPSEKEDWSLREDTYVGSSCCMSLLESYLRGDERIMDEFHRDGAVPAFFYYPLDGVDRDKVLDLREELEQGVLERAGEDAVAFVGGATGAACGYLDFIAWDLKAVLDAAVEVFAAAPVPWAGFHTFRRDVQGVSIKQEEEQP